MVETQKYIYLLQPSVLGNSSVEEVLCTRQLDIFLAKTCHCCPPIGVMLQQSQECTSYFLELLLIASNTIVLRVLLLFSEALSSRWLNSSIRSLTQHPGNATRYEHLPRMAYRSFFESKTEPVAPVVCRLTS